MSFPGATKSQPMDANIQYAHVLICSTRPLRRNSVCSGDRVGREMGVDEMNRLVRSLWAVTSGEDEEAQVAVAWLARNQICEARVSVKESCTRLLALSGQGARPKPDGQSLDFRDASFCRAFAIACTVWAGDCADPTEGATLAHRHDEEAPAWTERVTGTALIGPWMFYRAR